MKKLILLLCVLTMALTSCSSDDDSSASQDAIIGTWNYFKYFENGVELPLDPCENEDTIIISSNGNYSASYYIDNAGACILDETETGTWTNEGNGSYAVTINGFTYTEQVTFTSNTFYIEDTDDNGTPSDPSDDIVYRDVYVKQ